MAHEKLQRGAAPLSRVPRASWVALAVTWGIWAIHAFDREVILRLGPAITDHFKLSPEAWGWNHFHRHAFAGSPAYLRFSYER